MPGTSDGQTEIDKPKVTVSQPEVIAKYHPLAELTPMNGDSFAGRTYHGLHLEEVTNILLPRTKYFGTFTKQSKRNY